MLLTALTIIVMFPLLKMTRNLSITSVISLTCLYYIQTIVFWTGSWLSWAIMWELSSLGQIDSTTPQCRSRNGGIYERAPGRLELKDWLVYHGCLGRDEGVEHPVYGFLLLVVLCFAIMAIGGIILAMLGYFPFFKRVYLRLRAFSNLIVDIIYFLAGIFTFLAGILSYLAEFSVVTKPVELGQEVRLRKAAYSRLINENEEMRSKVLDYEAKFTSLEMIASWCSSYHANPDATAMKVQRDQLATSRQQHDRLLRDYTHLQQRCYKLELVKGDLKYTDVQGLRTTIESKEGEIAALQTKITAIEARPDADNLKAEKERVRVLQRKLDDEISQGMATTIKEALQGEEMQKMVTTTKQLRLEIKAAEERAQAVALGHRKEMEGAKSKLVDLEAVIVGMDSEVENAREESKSVKAANQGAWHDLEATRADFSVRFDQALATQRAELETYWRGEYGAAQKGFAEAAEAANARGDARIASGIQAARKELAEAAEAEFNVRIGAARKELAEAAEAEIESRVTVRLQTHVIEALAAKAFADATMGSIPFGEGDDEFDKAVAECPMEEDRKAEEGDEFDRAVAEYLMEEDLKNAEENYEFSRAVTQCQILEKELKDEADAAAAARPAAAATTTTTTATSPARKRPVGKRVKMNH